MSSAWGSGCSYPCCFCSYQTPPSHPAPSPRPALPMPPGLSLSSKCAELALPVGLPLPRLYLMLTGASPPGPCSAQLCVLYPLLGSHVCDDLPGTCLPPPPWLSPLGLEAVSAPPAGPELRWLATVPKHEGAYLCHVHERGGELQAHLLSVPRGRPGDQVAQQVEDLDTQQEELPHLPGYTASGVGWPGDVNDVRTRIIPHGFAHPHSARSSVS